MEKEELIRIIKNNIIKKQEEISLEELANLINQIINNISQVNILLLEKALTTIYQDKKQYNKDDTKRDINHFKALQFFITNDTILGNNYKITESQKEFIESILNDLKEYYHKKQTEPNKSSIISQRLTLLEKIANEDYIIDINLINQILEEENIDYKIRYEILVYILKRNTNTYLSQKTTPTSLKR